MDDKSAAEAGRQITKGTCPRCGQSVPRKAKGRPPIWCSQACRRAAYEERRAASAGAISVEVVEIVETNQHPLSECVDCTIASPVGCRRVIHELARLARDGTLQADPKWESTYLAIRGGLIDALYRQFGRR